jgi:probable HAF family extracellular repeat protein
VSGAAYINDLGQVVVTGCNADPGCALVRLDPVPEPATWLLLVAGMVPLFLLGLRRRRAHLSMAAVGALAVLAGAAAPAYAAVPPHYTLTPYVPQDAQAYPTAMSGIGHIAGIFYKSSPWVDQGGVPTPFVSTGDKVVDIGLLQQTFRASGINRHDAVAGTASLGELRRPRAFLYADGALHNLGTLGGRTSHANAVNDSGQVVGASSPSTTADVEHAFVWQHNLMRDIGTPGGAGSTSDAIDINNRGQIAGNWAEAGGPTRAFLYEDGAMQDLDTLGGERATVSALSQAGHVLGVSTGADGLERNFVFYQGAMSALIPSAPATDPFIRARDINSAGDAVGASYIWSGGVRYDLNTLLAPGWSVRDAVAINDNGQIAAVGCLAGRCDAVVLAPIPEPAQVLMLLAGLPLLGWLVRRHAQ